MFDANAAHIPNGELFFAEVHSTNELLLKHNIKQGDILLCEHVIKSGERSRTNELTKIWTSYKGEVIEYRDAKDSSTDDWSWLVYSGRPNGNGFLGSADGQRWKNKALQFLGGEWLDIDVPKRDFSLVD